MLFIYNTSLFFCERRGKRWELGMKHEVGRKQGYKKGVMEPRKIERFKNR
jgi:hypothetical protein